MVDETPEPGTFVLLGAGLALMGWGIAAESAPGMAPRHCYERK